MTINPPTGRPDVREQVADQCKAVAHLATIIAKVHSDKEKLLRDGLADRLLDVVGADTAGMMESLGEIVNDMDACQPEDEWTDPIFEKAQELFPAPRPGPTDVCVCGHVRDEHDRECTIEDCRCIYFELDPEADGPTRPSSASIDFSAMMEGLPGGPWTVVCFGTEIPSWYVEAGGITIAEEIMSEAAARAIAAIPDMVAEIGRLNQGWHKANCDALDRGLEARAEIERLRSENERLGERELDLENRCRSYADFAMEIARLRSENAEMREVLIAITDQLEHVGDTRMHKDGQFIADARAILTKTEQPT